MFTIYTEGLYGLPLKYCIQITPPPPDVFQRCSASPSIYTWAEQSSSSSSHRGVVNDAECLAARRLFYRLNDIWCCILALASCCADPWPGDRVTRLLSAPPASLFTIKGFKQPLFRTVVHFLDTVCLLNNRSSRPLKFLGYFENIFKFAWNCEFENKPVKIFKIQPNLFTFWIWIND